MTSTVGVKYFCCKIHRKEIDLSDSDLSQVACGSTPNAILWACKNIKVVYEAHNILVTVCLFQTWKMGSSFLAYTDPNQTLTKQLWQNITTSLPTYPSPATVKCVKTVLSCHFSWWVTSTPTAKVLICSHHFPNDHSQSLDCDKKKNSITNTSYPSYLALGVGMVWLLHFLFPTRRHMQQHWLFSNHKKAYVFFHPC